MKNRKKTPSTPQNNDTDLDLSNDFDGLEFQQILSTLQTLDINELVKGFLPTLPLVLKEYEQGPYGGIIKTISPYLSEFGTMLETVDLNAMLRSIIPMVPRVMEIAKQGAASGIQGLDLAKLDLQAIIQPILPIIQLILKSSLGQTLLSHLSKETSVVEDIISNTRVKVLNEIKWEHNDAIFSIKEAIRCKLLCGISIKKILTVNTRNTLWSLLPTMSVEEYSEMVNELFNFKLNRKLNTLMSYIPSEMLMAPFLFDDLEASFHRFKEEKVDVAAEIEQLAPLSAEPTKQSILETIKQTRALILDFSERYFSFENDIVKACSANGYTREQLVEWQWEMLNVLMTEVEKELHNAPKALYSVKIEHALMREFFNKPEFRVAKNLNSFVNQVFTAIKKTHPDLLSGYFKSVMTEMVPAQNPEQLLVAYQNLQIRKKALEEVKIQESKTHAALIQKHCSSGDIKSLKSMNLKPEQINHEHLFFAAINGRDDMIAHLCSNYRHIIKKGPEHTAFMKKCILMAAKKGHLRVIKVLLNKGSIGIDVLASEDLTSITDSKTKNFIDSKLKLHAKKNEITDNSSVMTKASPQVMQTQSNNEDEDNTAKHKQISLYFENAQQNSHAQIGDIIHTIQVLCNQLESKAEQSNVTDTIKKYAIELKKHQENYQQYIAAEVDCFSNFKKLKTDDQRLSQAHQLQKRHKKLTKQFTTLEMDLGQLKISLDKIAVTIASTLIQEPVVSSDCKDTAPAKKLTTLNSHEVKSEQKVKKTLVQSSVHYSTQTFFLSVSSQRKLTDFIDFAEHKHSLETLVNQLSQYNEFSISKSLPADLLLTFQSMQISAIQFAIMQLMQVQKDIATRLRIKLPEDEIRKIRNAFNHCKGFILEELKSEEGQQLYNDMLIFSKSLVTSINKSNCDELKQNSFYKKAIAHGTLLSTQLESKTKETITESDRMQYTFITGSQMLLFNQFIFPKGTSLPDGFRESALRMVNIKAQIYSFNNNPLVFREDAVQERHVSIQSFRC